MIFTDRKHAGQLLAEKLLEYRNVNPIVLALPRGGVPVAAEIATALGVQFEILAVRKIGAPSQPELAVGALCEEDDPMWNEGILLQLGIQQSNLQSIIQAERNKIHQQIELFRGGRNLPDVKKRVVIVVDDGLATGATVFAAVRYLKKRGPAKIIVAIPIAAASSARKLRSEVDQLIALEERKDLSSVGQWYMDFSQVSNEEVVALLGENLKKT